MAQSSFPFENIDTTETQYSQLFRTLNNGVNGTPDGGELEVDSAAAGLAVDIAAGQAMVRGHFYISTAVETRSLAVADPSDDRIDLVVLRLDPIANSVVLAVKTGVPDPAPVAPALVLTDGGIFEQPLAEVLVEANAGVPSTITDRREFMGTKLGTWTTAGRPDPNDRVIFGFNTTLQALEFYNPTSELFELVAPEINELNDIGDVVITSPVNGHALFYDGNNWINRFFLAPVEYVVIAGGAGGAGNAGSTGGGGGGGAGGYRSSVSGESSGGGAFAEASLTLSTGTHTVTVGGGGTGGDNNFGGDGINSVFASITSDGGGGGGYQDNNGRDGGSGGGGGGQQGNAGGLGTTDQGRNGGAQSGGNSGVSGGGGGASTAGNTAGAGRGGDGVASGITGTAVTRAGGGGGSAASVFSAGGTGGGGSGSTSTGSNGTVNFGAGGGGGRNIGGNGGSGVVIFKIQSNANVTFSGGVTETNFTSAGFTVYTVTAAGPTDTVTIA